MQRAGEVGAEFADTQSFDAHTVAKLKELRAAKIRALDKENYDLCKRIKAVEQVVRSLGAELAGLERDKLRAVSSENYDLATQLKQVGR